MHAICYSTYRFLLGSSWTWGGAHLIGEAIGGRIMLPLADRVFVGV